MSHGHIALTTRQILIGYICQGPDLIPGAGGGGTGKVGRGGTTGAGADALLVTQEKLGQAIDAGDVFTLCETIDHGKGCPHRLMFELEKQGFGAEAQLWVTAVFGDELAHDMTPTAHFVGILKQSHLGFADPFRHLRQVVFQGFVQAIEHI